MWRVATETGTLRSNDHYEHLSVFSGLDFPSAPISMCYILFTGMGDVHG
jgi:hypothetical protein